MPYLRPTGGDQRYWDLKDRLSSQNRYFQDGRGAATIGPARRAGGRWVKQYYRYQGDWKSHWKWQWVPFTAAQIQRMQANRNRALFIQKTRKVKKGMQKSINSIAAKTHYEKSLAWARANGLNYT